MNNLLGIDELIKKLYPGVKFELTNDQFTKWEHELPPPSWGEILNLLNQE